VAKTNNNQILMANNYLILMTYYKNKCPSSSTIASNGTFVAD